jgi:hypothetical protein
MMVTPIAWTINGNATPAIAQLSLTKTLCSHTAVVILRSKRATIKQLQ